MPRRSRNRKQRADDSPPKVLKEDLISQALQFHALYSQLPFHRTDQNPFCYLLERKWFKDWREYSGYQTVVNQNQQKTAKIGQKHPGIMNKELIDSKAELFEFPPEMPDFSYLNLKLSDKVDADQECIKLDEACWQFFKERYQGQQVKRPVSYSVRGKGFRPQFDCDLHSFYILVPVKSKLQDMRKIDQKTFQEDSESYLNHKKIQVPHHWTTEHLTDALRQLCFHYGSELNALWKFDNFMLFRQIREAVYQTYTKGGQQGLHATRLDEKQFDQLKLKYFLKEAYLVFAQIELEGKADLHRVEVLQEPEGYCQSCFEIKKLPFTCQCARPYYCSLKCLHDDRAFHNRLCQQAYESDEEEIQWKSSRPQSTLLNLGNTCYMNSALQALCGAEQLVEYLSYQKYKEETKEESVFLQKASRLFRQVRGNTYCEPYSFKSAFERNCLQFKGYLQHDCCDFINYFLASLNEQIAPDKAACQLVLSSFTGKFTSKIACPVCKYENSSEESFTILPLPIRQKSLSRSVRIVVVQGLAYKFIRVQNPSEMSSWEKLGQLSGVEQSWISIGKQRGDLALINPQQQKLREVILRAAQNKLDVIVQQGRPDYEHNVQIQYEFRTELAGQVSYLSFAFNRFTAVNPEDSIADLLLNLLIDHDPAVGQMLLLRMQELRAKKINFLELKDQEKSQLNKSLYEITSKAAIQLILLPQKSTKRNCRFCDKRNCKRCLMRPDLFANARQALDTEHCFYKICVRYGKQPAWYNSEQRQNQKQQMIKLQNCISQFSEPEILDEQNAWYCQQCQDMRLAQKTLVVAEGPKYLIIQLKRFRTQAKRKLKNCQPVAYQEQLFFAGRNYSLVAVIIHQGSLEAGHYWALRVSEKGWQRWQDQSVSEAKSCWSSGAYVLLYSLK